MFKKWGFKKLLLVGVALIALLTTSLLVAQTFFFQVPGGGLIFDQFGPVIRYAGRLSFQNLTGTLYFKAPLTATGTLDFSSATTGTCSTDLTIPLTGVVQGDTVILSPPIPVDPGGLLAGSMFFAWISTADTVHIRHCNISAGTVDPASGVYRVDVFGH